MRFPPCVIPREASRPEIRPNVYHKTVSLLLSKVATVTDGLVRMQKQFWDKQQSIISMITTINPVRFKFFTYIVPYRTVVFVSSFRHIYTLSEDLPWLVNAFVHHTNCTSRVL